MTKARAVALAFGSLTLTPTSPSMCLGLGRKYPRTCSCSLAGGGERQQGRGRGSRGPSRNYGDDGGWPRWFSGSGSSQTTSTISIHSGPSPTFRRSEGRLTSVGRLAVKDHQSRTIQGFSSPRIPNPGQRGGNAIPQTGNDRSMSHGQAQICMNHRSISAPSQTFLFKCAS